MSLIIAASQLNRYAICLSSHLVAKALILICRTQTAPELSTVYLEKRLDRRHTSSLHLHVPLCANRHPRLLNSSWRATTWSASFTYTQPRLVRCLSICTAACACRRLPPIAPTKALQPSLWTSDLLLLLHRQCAPSSTSSTSVCPARAWLDPFDCLSTSVRPAPTVWQDDNFHPYTYASLPDQANSQRSKLTVSEITAFEALSKSLGASPDERERPSPYHATQYGQMN